MLESETIRLRAFEKSDLLALHGWENLSEFWRSSTTLAPYSLRNVMDYLAGYEADPFHSGQLRLMVESRPDEHPLGFVELYEVEVRHRRANIGILIDPHYQRRHFGLEALALLEHYCAAHLMLRQLLAYVPADNEASLRLFARAGFSRIATLPEWIASAGNFTDAVIFQKFLTQDISPKHTQI